MGPPFPYTGTLLITALTQLLSLSYPTPHASTPTHRCRWFFRHHYHEDTIMQLCSSPAWTTPSPHSQFVFVVATCWSSTSLCNFTKLCFIAMYNVFCLTSFKKSDFLLQTLIFFSVFWLLGFQKNEIPKLTSLFTIILFSSFVHLIFFLSAKN